MRKIKLAIILFMIAGLMVFIGRPEPTPAASAEPLRTALYATGATLREFTVNGWTELPADDLDNDALLSLVSQTMTRLGYTQEAYQINRRENENQRFVRASIRNDQQHVVAIAQVLRPVKPDKGPEVYLVINVDEHDAASLAEWREKITASLQDAGGLPRISSCLVGWIDGKLDAEEWTRRLEGAFQAIDAMPHHSSLDAKYASLTGFAPSIADYIQVGNKKVNVNMAMRYSPYDNRTYVLVGSPVITREY